MTETAQLDHAIPGSRFTAWRLYVPALVESTWALLCGALAASSHTWHSHAWARLALAWLAVAVLIGLAFWAWIQLRYDRWRPGRVAAVIAASTILGLVAAANAGPLPLAVWSVGLVAAAVAALACQHRPPCLVRWLAGIYVAMAWVAGSYALAFEVGLSPAIGGLFGLGAYASVYRLQRGGSDATMLLYVIWGALLALLLALQQPLAVALLAGAALSQQSWDRRAMARLAGDIDLRLPSLTGRLGWMAALVVAALAISGWGYWP